MHAVFEHASSIRRHQQHACRTLEILLHILEIVYHFLIFNQLSQCSDIGNSILDDLSILDLGFITYYICSIKHLKQSCFHLICVVILPRLESHLAEAFNS